MLTFFVALGIVLIVGTFGSTFFYHVPQHIRGKNWERALLSRSPLVRVARALGLVLPEDHNGHHMNPEVEFGDLFRFYDAPARAVIAKARGEIRRCRQVTGRLERRRALRGAGGTQ